MQDRKLYLETFLIALAVILLEVSYTRVFSFKLVYYFTYLIIGIALLGLGAGGVFIAMFPFLRRIPLPRLVLGCCLVAGAAVLGGYFLVALLPLNLFDLITDFSGGTRRAVAEAWKLALVCVTLFTPFFSAGLALAAIFATQTARINRLYFVDLLGAGLGCALAVALMVHISPPGTVMVAGLCFILAGVRLAAAESPAVLASMAVVGVALAAGAVFPGRLPDPVPDRVKTMAPPAEHRTHDVAFSQWSPVFRVDVLRIPTPDAMFLAHDGTLGSSIRRFDGDLASLTRYESDERSYPFRLLEPAPRVAIIGAAGGNEILASLHFKAAHVTGVELNPVTVSLLTTHFADYSGHLSENPRVTLVNAEGRSFLKSHREQYDLIWLVAPDSYASMNAATSGAFVLSESYLYTTEMVREALAHLSDGGVICAQFGEVKFDQKPHRTARYLATAREAFRQLGVDDFRRHVLVATSPGFEWYLTSTILLGKSPFSEGDVQRFLDATAKVPGSIVRHVWTQADHASPVSQVISLPQPELERWYASHPFNLRPVTDDSPFFWHFVRFGDATLGSLNEAVLYPEEGMGERLLFLLLYVATLFAALFLLAPLLSVRRVWRTIPYKVHAGVYFAALGLGFMFLEVSLIQRLTLFLGYPTYSLTVTLFALLVSTGVGSLVSERFAARRNALLLGLGASVLLLVLVYQQVLPPIVDRAGGWSLPLRVALALAFLTPLGLCLGAFMPLGLRTVAALTPYAQEYVAWSWAVNGFFSVVSSVLATLLSMTFGFDRVMLIAAAVYMVGIAALLRVPAPATLGRPSASGG